MSMRKEHTQAIADKLAIDDYGMLFGELPQSEQKILFNKAQRLADKELIELTEGK
jgi:hypothetical protein